MKKIYFASSITYAPEEFKQAAAALMLKLRETCQLNEYFGTAEAPANEVYLHDKKCIDEAEMVIAEVTYPSHGVGYEIGYSLAAGKKVFAFAKEGISVSRMIAGITDPNFSFRTYKVTDEIIELIKSLK